MHWRMERAMDVVGQATHRSFARRILPVECEGGIISFTFDDIPRSAAIAGGKVLESYGVSGTFYLAGALVDTEGDTEPFYSAGDVSKLVDRGHEIGCHTFWHSRVSDLDISALNDECDRNQSWMTALAPDYTLRSFAYPGGGSEHRRQASARPPL